MRYDELNVQEIRDTLMLMRNGVKGSTQLYGLASGKCHLPTPSKKSMRITYAVIGILITTIIIAIWQSQF
jgi:hypothetical protein